MTSPIIDVAALRTALVDPGSAPVLLDVRYRLGGSQEDAYLAGHVPGAAFVDLDRDLAGAPGSGGRHPLPDPDTLAAALRRAGVRRNRGVVVYDDWSSHAAARCWWLLRHHGHDDVRVLDGGWRAWTEAGGAIATGPEDVAPGDFVAGPGRMPVVEADEVPSAGVLIDVRAPERFRGESEPVDPVAGHIPGARNVPTADTLDDAGRFLAAEDLRARFARAGVGPDADVALYCGSGVTAAHGVLALEIAGLPGVAAALYPGSWSGWITDPGRPVATGPEQQD